MRRTRAEVRLGEALRIGQQWRRPDGEVWTIRQVWRADTRLQLRHPDGRIETVTFEDLAAKCRQVDPMELTLV